MKTTYSYPEKCLLANGIKITAWQQLMSELGAVERTYKKGEFVAREGDPADKIGIVVAGKVVISRQRVDGARVVIENLLPQASFGASYVYTGATVLTVNIVAAEPTRLILIDSESVPDAGRKPSQAHVQLIRNVFRVISLRNLQFKQRIRILTQRTIRGKLLTYLNIFAKRVGKTEFDIPYDRQQLADHLCVDRSALSEVIAKLREERVLESARSHFKLFGK